MSLILPVELIGNIISFAGPNGTIQLIKSCTYFANMRKELSIYIEQAIYEHCGNFRTIELLKYNKNVLLKHLYNHYKIKPDINEICIALKLKNTEIIQYFRNTLQVNLSRYSRNIIAYMCKIGDIQFAEYCMRECQINFDQEFNNQSFNKNCNNILFSECTNQEFLAYFIKEYSIVITYEHFYIAIINDNVSALRHLWFYYKSTFDSDSDPDPDPDILIMEFAIHRESILCIEFMLGECGLCSDNKNFLIFKNEDGSICIDKLIEYNNTN